MAAGKVKAWPGGAFSWAKRLDGWALFAFCCGTAFLHGGGQQRLLGMLMVAGLFFANVSRLPIARQNVFPPPPEILCYTLWVLWAGLTGPLVMVDKALFVRSLQISAQMVVMVWVVYAILQNQKSVDVIFAAFLAGAVVQIVAVGAGVQSAGSLLTANERAMGLTQNANSLGFRMLWGVFAALFFWHLPGWKKFLRWSAFLALTAAAGYIILSTGSRKSALAMVLMIGCWTIFGSSLTAGFRGYFRRALVVVTVLAIFTVLVPFVMQQTLLGDRFGEFLEGGRKRGMSTEEVDLMQAAEQNSRYWMYVEGLRLFADNPVFGVGLGNFNSYSKTGQYSHSDYIEPLACTGLVGFMLYHAFMLLLLLRIHWLLKRIDNPQIKYRLKLCGIGLLTIMAIGLGTAHYTSQPTFLLLTAFSAFTWRLLRSVKGRLPQAA